MLTEADFKFIPFILICVLLCFGFSPTTVTEDPVSLTSRTVSKFRNSRVVDLTIKTGIWATIKKALLQRKKEGNGAGFPIGTFAREKGTGQLSLVRTNRQVPLSILFTWQVIEPGRTSAVRTCPAPPTFR
ncbi:hypothetical protein CDAR_426481 [Caerostris darwini]|uniref:Secreted protein n=1 Tax=Caerostris darwini TaxID=1538125 RepID=A0AAV4S0D3_9ARAC|nr:hypothetical protein CDAR_426481 [Caerostris darwini]